MQGGDLVSSSTIMARGSLACLGIYMLVGGWIVGRFMGEFTACIWFSNGVNG